MRVARPQITITRGTDVCKVTAVSSKGEAGPRCGGPAIGSNVYCVQGAGTGTGSAAPAG